MDMTYSAMLRSWEWRFDIIAVLLIMGTFYTRGWIRLRRRNKRLAKTWKLLSYISGLILIAITLMSFIDIFGSLLFYMHMIQHLLLVMLAPPLLLIANPFPFFLWGIPDQLRPIVAGLFTRNSEFRKVLAMATRPMIAWLVFIIFFLGWHDPKAYNAALWYDWVHDLEHITFFGAAMLYWWHVIQPGPRIHGKFTRGARIAYLLVTVPINMMAGLMITFSEEPLYSYYTTVPHFGDMTVMKDQMLSGMIMWIPGSMMYLLAAIILIAVWVQDESEKEPLPESKWATDEAMVAPSLEKL